MKKLFLVTCAVLIAISASIVQADSTPTMSRVYGNQFTPGVADSQPLAAIGSLDSTFGSGGIFSVNSALSGSQGVGIQVLPSGNFLEVLSLSGSASVVAMYNAQGVLQTSGYGTSGIATLGTSSTSTLPRATMLDTQGRLLVAGGAASGTAGWIFRLTTAGIASAFTTGTAWQYIGGIAQQSTGSIVAVGFNGANAQIGRYTLSGTLDTTFGTAGLVVFNGSGSVLPTATTGLVSVVVDSSDRIYIAFIASSTGHSFTANSAYIVRLTSAGVFDTTWGTSGVLPISALNSATSGLYIARNYDGNFIVGAQVSTNIKVTGVTSSGGTISGFTTFNSSVISSDTFSIKGLSTTSDDSIFVVGSDTTAKSMAVIRLVGATGLLDTAFNSTGYNIFNLSTPDTTSIIQASAVAPDGQLYTTGYQVNSATTVPYVSRLNNTPYVYQVAQYPSATEQGILDKSFGNTATQTYAGVVSPFNGKYGSSMMQQPQAMIEVLTTSGVATGVPAVGDIVVGMNGYTDSSANSTMMLSWLTAAGAIDTTINAAGAYPGYLTLTNSLTNEYLTSLFQGVSGVIYVAGYSSATVGGASTGALLRAYTTGSTSNWTVGTPIWSAVETAANYKAIGVGSQSSNRTLLFVQDSATTCHISAYTSLGLLDTSFGVGVTGGSGGFGGTGGSGQILYNSYSGLNMGPIYASLETGAIILGGNTLLVAYINSSNSTNVDIAAFLPDGSGLDTGFNTTGIVSNVFSGHTINSNNIRMCFNASSDLVVSAVDTSGNLLLASFDTSTGAAVAGFNGGAVLSIAITGVTSGLNLKAVSGVSDGSIIATFWNNAADDTMYIARILADGSGLDTTFNSQGSQPGVLPMQIGNKVADYNARVMTSTLIQSAAGANQGNIVMASYESVTSADSTPMIMRSYGAATTTEIPYYPTEASTSPVGTLQAGYDLNSLLGAGAAKAMFVYPSGNASQGMMLVGYDNGTTSKIARLGTDSQALDNTFGTAGIYTIAGSLTGINSLSIDAKNNILVSGVTTGGSPTAWAQVLSPTASTATTFTLPGTVTAVNQILQQQSGRYILAAKTSSAGLVLAFQDKLVSPATSLAIDPTFNPLGVGGATSGSYAVGTTGVYSIAINSDDTILAVYKNATPVLAVVKITANGSGLVSGFGTSGTLLTTIVPDSSNVSRVAIDSTGKVVVAASCGTGTSVKVARYTAAGATDSTWNGSGISSSVQTISNLGSSGITLATLMETVAQQTILMGYNTAGGNGRLFAVRLASNGALDPAWNSAPTSPDTAGVLTFTTNSATALNASGMDINGTILAVGQQAGGTAGHPIALAIYGDLYVSQISENPLESPAGTLDLTIPGNTSGALALSGTITGVPQKVYIFNNNSNGAMMVASSNGTNSYVTKLNADLSLATYGTAGVATLTGKININDMYITATETNNSAGPIFVTGDDGLGAMWGAQLNAAGTSITYLPSSGTLTTGRAIRQTTNSRVLVAGSNGSSGAIAAFTSSLSGLDTSFGNGSGTGIYTTGVANQICDMALDTTDRIYIAYKLSSSVISVVRLLANGTAVDTTFSPTFITGTAYSATQIRLALDTTNNQIVVAAQDGTGSGNIIQVARFSTNGGTANGAISTVTIPLKILNLSDLFIDAASNIYVVGYNSTDNKPVVARIKSTSSTVIALDTTNYAVSGGTPGIANLAIGSMTVATAGAYDPDRRTYIVGSNGSTSGYIARLFGDVYTAAVSEATIYATVGSIDTTLYPNLTGGIDLSGQTGWSSLAAGYKAQAIIENQNADGSAFIAFGNGTNLIVGKVNSDMVPMTFGTATLTVATPMATVNSITQDAFGNIIVAGTNAGALKVVSFTSAGVLNATFNQSTLSPTVGTTVQQQKSGRYIVGSKIGSVGAVCAYQNQSAISAAALPVDPTFGPSALGGYYSTGINAQIDDLVIDNQDYIYLVYRNATNNVMLEKITANGSGKVSAANSPIAFASGAAVDTGIVGTAPARIAINAAGNILVGASTSATNVSVRLYNGSTGAAIAAAASVTSTNSPILTKLVGSIASPNEFYGTMYNTTPAVTTFAVTSAGVLDSSFGTGGLVTTTVQSPIQVNGMSIQFDGKLAVVGYNNAGAGSTADPILLRFYAYPYISEYAQAPDQVAAGIFDTTLWPTVGALELDTYAPISTTITTLGGSSVKRIYEYPNGKALFACDNANFGADTIIVRVNKDLTLDTSFNTTGAVTISGQTNLSGLFVDSNNNIYVAGGITTSWLRAYTNAGAPLPGWVNPTVNLSNGAYQVATQSTNRIIVAGKNTNGALQGYTTTGAIDTSFGINGIVDMGSTLPITDFAIDQYNNIITVANNAGTVVLQKVTTSGLTVTNISANGTAISTATAGSDIKVVLDASGNIVVAAATSTGFVLSRYTNNNSGGTSGVNSAGPVTITATNATLANIYATSDGKITLLGYTSSGSIIVARLTSAFALDTTAFNAAGIQPGVITTTAGALNVVYDGIICADDRIMVAGTNSVTAEPYLARIFGDTYVSFVSFGNTIGVAGTLNTAFGSTTPPTGQYILSTLNSLLVGGKGQAILGLSNGGYYMALDNANSAGNSVLIRTRTNGTLDTSYNAAGSTPGIAGTGSSSYAPLGVSALLEDSAGGVVLVGTASGSSWVQRYTSAGVLDTTFGTSGRITTASAMATTVLEQTIGRLVVAGGNASGGALFAYTSVDSATGTTGAVDVTFNTSGTNAATGGTTPGIFLTNTTNNVYTLVSDQYNRLIYAVLNNAGTAVDLYRLNQNGTYDTTFGTGGKVADALTAVNSPSQIRVALDAAGNIIVAATSSTLNTFSVRAYNNGIVATAGANGSPVYAQLDIASLTQSPIVTGLVTTADGKALILGIQSGTSAAWVARITSAGALDTTAFNPSAIGGLAGIFQYSAGGGTTAHVYRGISVNKNGTLGMVGFENSSGTFTPSLVSLYDVPYTSQQSQSPDTQAVGTLDLTLAPNYTGGVDLSTLTGWSSLSGGYRARAVIANPAGDGSSFVAFANGTNLIVGKVSINMVPMTFGTATLTVPLAMTTVNSMTVDAQGNIIVAGTNAGAQKVVTFTSAGVLNATYNAPTVASTVGMVVGQQKSGRYLVGGYTGTSGMISAYQNASAISSSSLPVDPTFGPAGQSGYYLTGVNAQIDDMVIDGQDYIYIVYRNAGTNNVMLAKITANGSGLVSAANSPVAFANGAAVDTGIVGTQQAHIAINQAGNILVGAATSANVTVRLYNGSTGAAIAAAQVVTTASTPVLTSLVGSIAATNEFYGSISNTSTPSSGSICAITSAGILDTNFGTNGLVTTTVQSPVKLNSVTIMPDGRVVVVGYNNAGAGTTSDPILLRLYGYQYASLEAQAPNIAPAGLLDTTLWPTVGALELSTYSPISTTLTTLPGSAVKRIYEYPNGKALFVCDYANGGLDTVLVRVNKDLTLDTTFNTTGYVTISGKINVSSLFIDSNNNIYVAGGTSTSWLRVYTNAGAVLPGWVNPTQNLSNGAFQVATQSNSRIILAGKNTNGVLYGYTPKGVLDNSFGVGGVVDMGSTLPITDFTIDANNNIITVANNGGTVVLQKVSASGLTVTNISGNGTAIATAALGSEIKVVLDASGNIVVAAATATGYILSRYTNNNSGGASGVDSAGPITIVAATPILANIYATSDGKITLLGYDVLGDVVVARLTSAFALDTTAFDAAGSQPGVLTTPLGDLNVVYDGIICPDDRIMIAGTNATAEEPYIGRVFGDTYVSYITQGNPIGVAGTLNTTFGNTVPATGQYALSTLNSLLVGGKGQAILPYSTSGYYVALNNANSATNSILVRLLESGALDTSYNTGGTTPGIAGSTGSYAPLGVNSILQDGSNRVLLVGTTAGAGWVQRYTANGPVDTTFGTSGRIAVGTSANVAVEQTLARLVVAGGNGSGGALFAFTSIDPLTGTTGAVDVTFNSTGTNAATGGTTPGIFLTNTTNSVYSLVADQYDRLIYPVLNNAGTAVDLYRLTASGEHDATFGTGGKVANALTSVSSASQIRVALDASGNIIVAATSSTANTFSVAAFDNGTSATAGANGAPVVGYAQLNVSSLTNSPVVTNLITSADGYTFVMGTQSGVNPAWVARITAAGALDTTLFNPNAIGGVAGIFQYSIGGGTTAHVYNSLAVSSTSTLTMVGFENSAGVFTPTLVSINDGSFTSQQAQSPNSKAVGTNDLTLGVSPTAAANKGITFYGSGASASYGQVARAIGLYDNNNIVVAIDGGNAASGNSSIFIDMFDNDGLLNPNFGTGGQATVLSATNNYQNQYVRDMITFTTTAGVHKAILAGYVQNTTLNTTDSLVVQYNLSTGSIDTTFGGFDGNPSGIAFGDGKQAFVVGQQSSGRIIVGGLSQNNLGVLLGYTASGKLDTSFGNDGYQSVNTGSSGIYSHAIDLNNRIVVVYNNAGAVNVVRFLADGSAVDSTFDASASYMSTVTSNSNMKVAVDSSNNVVAAAITGSGNTISVKSYSASNGTQTHTAAIAGSSLGNVSAVYNIGRLLVDMQGNVIVVAYDTNANNILVTRLTSSLVLDTTFNGTGYITYAVADGTTTQTASDAIIHPDGRIIVVGAEA